MTTPGFRLFFGFAAFGLIVAGAYGVASGDLGGKDYLGIVDPAAIIGVLSLGWKGGVGDHVGYTILVMFAVASAFVGSVLVAFRDADPEQVAEITHDGKLPPPDGPAVASYQPIVGAFGAGVVVVGLVTHAAVFVAGLIVVGIAMFEWMIAAWADRATGDPATNRALRNRVMLPYEVPFLAAAGVAVLVLAFSRVLLAVSELQAVWVATAVATIILLVAVAFAVVPKVDKSVVAGVVALLAIGVLAAGVVSASVGERDFEHHEEDHGGEEEPEEALSSGVGSATAGQGGVDQ